MESVSAAGVEGSVREKILLVLDDGQTVEGVPKFPTRLKPIYLTLQRTTGSRGDHQPLGVIELPSTRAARAAPHDALHAACGRRRLEMIRKKTAERGFSGL